MLLIEEKRPDSEEKAIPEELIYEMRDGSPIYYRDYRKVVSGEKTLEEIMGSSYIQWKIITIILKFLFFHLDLNKYEIATNEVGFQWAPKTWRNLDIAIFNKNKLEKEGLHNHFVKTPPEIVIEVDTKADLTKYNGIIDFYMREKAQDLLDSGVKKVIWFTTADKRVMIAEKDKPWLIDKWNKDIDLIENLKLNLGNLMEKENRKESSNG